MREAQPVELDEWRTVDVSEWPTYAPNATGRRLEFCLEDPRGRQWLLEQPDPRPREAPGTRRTDRTPMGAGTVHAHH